MSDSFIASFFILIIFLSTAGSIPSVAAENMATTSGPIAQLSDSEAIGQCLAKLAAGQYDKASPNNVNYAVVGQLNCMQGIQTDSGHERYATVSVTAYDKSGQRVQVAGDFYDPNWITMYQSGKTQFEVEIGDHSYAAMVDHGVISAYNPEIDNQQSDAVNQGPVFGKAGEMKIVAVKELPPAEQQGLQEAKDAAIKAQEQFIAELKIKPVERPHDAKPDVD